jgi:hypothetical protein
VAGPRTGRYDLPAGARFYEKVHQIDFTSLYPSIIVKYNLAGKFFLAITFA